MASKMLRNLIISVMVAAVSFCAHALKIEINKGRVTQDPIAIVDFYENDGEDSDVGSEICKIIRSNLETSGLFIPINPVGFLESKKTLCQNGPNIKNWSVLNARFLVHGKITSGWGLEINFELVDVVTGAKMLTTKVSGSKSKLRQVAHIVSDLIYERITTEKGYFNTNIIYVETVSGGTPKHRKTRLVKIDQDGYGPMRLTNGDELVLTPRYSADGKHIAYISYRDKARDALGKSAHVYMMNASNGSVKPMISNDIMKILVKQNNERPVQMTYAPRFSPDGNEAVLAIVIGGRSAIYKLDFVSNRLTQLTEHQCIDTSPCFSPDGQQIVFTSNRHGREAIYTMNSDGSNQQRISTGEGKYSQPVWSPRGDLLAFSKQVGGQFFIGVMKPDGTGERLITSGYLVEAPCWASNGRYLTYSAEARPGAPSCISVVDITGYHVRIVNTVGDGSYPAWSPTFQNQN
ncbi:MAG: Tol-Pal system protein TolB [Holosporales bacterium]|jgi:TolB protein|nr:Tol-Pal system protein TolB [Holosporales bacterium]